MTISQILGYPRSFSCHLTGTRMRQTHRMLWIGAIFGALFGWIGILVAALFWATLAIFKLIWAVIVFGFQALLWVWGCAASCGQMACAAIGTGSPNTRSDVQEGLYAIRLEAKANQATVEKELTVARS